MDITACLAPPTIRACRRTRRSTQKPIKMALKTRRCTVPSCGKKQSLYCLPSGPNIRKDWMNFIFNEDPDHVSKNSVLCSLHFTADSFTNKGQWLWIFKKIETKRRCCTDYIGSDSNVATQVWVTVFIIWSLLLCLFLQIAWYVLSYLCVLMHIFAPIQTECSDEVG